MTSHTRHLHAVPPVAPRVYDSDFRAGAVARVNAGEPVAAVARDVGVARNTLKNWVSKADESPAELHGGGVGIVVAAESGSLRETLVALRAEIAGRIGGVSNRDLPAYIRLLLETMREIHALDTNDPDEEPEIPDEPMDPEEL